MSKKVSMQAIADKLGVTKVSVSKALNGKEGISHELERKILAVASEMNYDIGKLVQKETQHDFVFLVLAEFFEKRGESFYTKIYSNLNSQCMLKGAKLNLIIITCAEHDKLVLPKMLIENKFDGIFIAGEVSDAYVSLVKDINSTLVCLDFSPKTVDSDCVISDNFFLGYSATAYLIREGHTKIAFLGLPTKTDSVCDRFFGYRKALYENGIEVNSEYLLNNENPFRDLYAVDIELPSDLPTACVCNCDAAAFYFAGVLNNKGLSVGSSISLISFDNTEICDAMNPGLTSYNIDKHSFARLGYMLISERIKAPGRNFARVYSENNLVERESVCKLIKRDIGYDSIG